MSDMVPFQQKAGLETFDATPQRILTSIDTTTKAGRLAAYKANKGESQNLLDMVNVPLTAVAWTAHDASKVDETTGEVVELVRLALTLDTGEVYQTFSDYIRRDFLKLLYVHGADIGAEPMTFIVRKQARGAKSFYTLEYVETNDPKFRYKSKPGKAGKPDSDQASQADHAGVSSPSTANGDTASAKGPKSGSH